MVKSTSATAVSDLTESTSSATTAATTTAAKPQSKKPESSSTKQPSEATAADKKDGVELAPAEDVSAVEEHTGNSPPLSIASSDDICEYNLFSDEDTESDASLGECKVVVACILR